MAGEELCHTVFILFHQEAAGRVDQSSTRLHEFAGIGENVGLFLLAFGQFEIAALMGVGTWTVWLFDAQAGGLPLQDSLWYALGPMLCELGVLSPLVVMLLWVGQRLPAPAERGTVRLRRGGRIVVRLYLVAALAGGYLVPAWVVLRQTPSGFASLVSNFTILAELRVSLLFAVSASAIPWPWPRSWCAPPAGPLPPRSGR